MFPYTLFVSFNVGPKGQRRQVSNHYKVDARNIPHAIRLVQAMLPEGAIIVGKADIRRTDR